MSQCPQLRSLEIGKNSTVIIKILRHNGLNTVNWNMHKLKCKFLPYWIPLANRIIIHWIFLSSFYYSFSAGAEPLVRDLCSSPPRARCCCWSHHPSMPGARRTPAEGWGILITAPTQNGTTCSWIQKDKGIANGICTAVDRLVCRSPGTKGLKCNRQIKG